MRIQDISIQNRPRERLQREGAMKLSDAELMAIVLQKGVQGENVIDVSNRLIAMYGLERLGSCGFEELKRIKGIGNAKASQIIALFELGKRAKVQKYCRISNAKDVYNYAKPRLQNDREQFMVILLDSKNKVIKDEIVSVGTLNSAIIHPREVFKTAIKESANAVIIVHNHPSGDCTPSEEDLILTRKVVEAGDVVGITVLDHVIVGEGMWSWKETKQ